MEVKQSVQTIFQEMKFMEESLLSFLENESIQEEESFQSFLNSFSCLQAERSKHEFKMLLYLISTLSLYHHKLLNFISRIEQILTHFQPIILQFFTNLEIFNAFKRNKRILLFLLNKNILTLDNEIVSIISSKEKYTKMFYLEYFSPEIKLFKENTKLIDKTDQDTFQLSRLEGENNGYLCQLIRKDSINEFVSFVNRTNISLFTIIEPSIYDTNIILLQHSLSLIEYSAFFGSLQIFKYLQYSKVPLTPSLWIYAIHGKNAEIIHILEENGISQNDGSYTECLIESIKCHHNDISNYIVSSFMKDNKNDFLPQSLKYYNYIFHDINGINFSNAFYYFCKYDYSAIVNFLLNDKSSNIKSQIILTFLM